MQRMRCHAVIASIIRRRDLGTRTTCRAGSCGAFEFAGIPRATLATRTFFPTSWYRAVTLVGAIAKRATLFVLEIVEPILSFRIAGKCEPFVGAIDAISDRFESRALAKQRDGVFVAIEIEHAGASQYPKASHEQGQGTT